MSQVRDAVSRNCTNCGAALDAAPEGTTIVCRYCGTTFQAPAQMPPPPRIVVLQPGRPMPQAPGAAGRVVRATASAFAAVVAVGAVSYFAQRGKGAVGALTSLPSFPTSVVQAVTSEAMWDTVAGPPISATLGAAEGFVGRVRARGSDELFVAAYDDEKLGQAWKVGPFGTYTQGYQSTFTGVVGHSVIVTDYRANLHVYDAATGKETRTLKLSDRAKSMCTAPDGKGRVWIEVSDEKNVMFDVEAGTQSPAGRPAWCPDLWAASHDCRGWLKRGGPVLTCKGPEAAPKVPGFEAENVVEDGELAVALGKKHPGTALPIVVGFDPKTKTVRWQQSLAPGDQSAVAESSTTSIMDALAGGRFAAPYELTSKGWHFTAFDARSGQRAWDVTLQPLIGVDEPEGFSMNASRVYVMRTSSLEVYDAKTGALVGTIGG
jgi:hypothetical protein